MIYLLLDYYRRSGLRLQELTIIDGFMFGAVMAQPDNCQELLERILGRKISKVDVIREKSLIYNPEYKGIRLDVFARDEEGTRFDVEIQVRTTPVEKRSRYYHSQMDMDMLLKSVSYSELPDSYVIFICNYDPLGFGKYRYTIESHCRECPGIEYNDGVHTILLNNRGDNPEEVPEELITFLQFTKKSLAESEEESDDIFIQKIQNDIRLVKSSREMGEKYMKFQEMLKEEREEGRKEGREEVILEMFSEGTITKEEGARKLNISLRELENLYDNYLKNNSSE